MVGIGRSIRSRSVGAVDPVIGLVQWLSKSKPVEDSFNPPLAFFCGLPHWWIPLTHLLHWADPGSLITTFTRYLFFHPTQHPNDRMLKQWFEIPCLLG